jgi:hypothetical protein
MTGGARPTAKALDLPEATEVDALRRALLDPATARVDPASARAGPARPPAD